MIWNLCKEEGNAKMIKGANQRRQRNDKHNCKSKQKDMKRDKGFSVQAARQIVILKKMLKMKE